jgi:hypothetical protein
MFQTNRSCYDLTHEYVEYCNRMFAFLYAGPYRCKGGSYQYEQRLKPIS